MKIALSLAKAKFRILSFFSPRRAAMAAFDLFCTPTGVRPSEPAPLFASAEQLEFVFKGVKVKGYHWHRPGRPRLLIVHGFSSHSAKFEYYINSFYEKGFDVFAFDAPAHGMSGGKRINAVVYQEMIMKIINDHGPFQAYMAHSFGCLCLTLALEQSEQMPDQRVVMIAAATETVTAINNFFNLLQLNNKVRSHFDEHITKLYNRSPGWYSIGRAIDSVKGEILWLHDEHDDTTPISDVLKIKARNLPNLQLRITTGLGHSRIYRDAAVRGQVIDFITSLNTKQFSETI